MDRLALDEVVDSLVEEVLLVLLVRQIMEVEIYLQDYVDILMKKVPI